MPSKQEDREDLRFRILKLIEQNPELNQRELATHLGVSLGKANYVLKALVGKGMVKLENFNKNPNKLGYAYLLTPTGIAEKSKLTMAFLKRKTTEYELLKAEIESLQKEVNGVNQ
ncbi:MAG: MarR family EPS-associated transcriptional regulator [Limnobacter sp.]|uniref:MarR family EPS-associated transcriptional regulator n=1 Tax=Limnobacter sp. TaxID=2003368 RepID=UPI0032EB4399